MSILLPPSIYAAFWYSWMLYKLHMRKFRCRASVHTGGYCLGVQILGYSEEFYCTSATLHQFAPVYRLKMYDPRPVIGTCAHAKATHVDPLAQSARWYWRFRKTKLVPDTVTNVVVESNGCRASTILYVDWNLPSGAMHKRVTFVSSRTERSRRTIQFLKLLITVHARCSRETERETQ